ncbi:restriction endonuclease subunit S [uncultured Aliiroseovarius sp.]|uniref:restriction endonuclease subunit S n=1 Tax=uncultured Aliiroseovarius sp. TaxID=1658783 RepID=UPI00261B06AA|nr:restriction endonuclease subunit S [uncultured Aliiroseovarius sp.]
MRDQSKLPKGWRIEKLPKILQFLPGKAHERFIEESGRFVVANSKFVSTSGKVRKFSSKNVSPAQAGDVLIVMSDLPNGRALGKAYLVSQGEEIAVNQRVCALRAKHGEPAFYFYFLDRNRYFLDFDDGINQTHLLNPVFEECPIVVPPLPEQRKIAEILRTWDEALDKLTALCAAKEKRLGALRYAMLFGELRLDDTRRNWAPTRLAAVTHELTSRNGANGLGRDFVMGVTKAQGVVPMREQTIAGDIRRYKRLPPRAFAYNPMRINVGSIAMNERDEEVLVSPDYVVFTCNANDLDPDYLDHLRKTSWWAHYINSGGSGSVRQRTYYDDLAALKLPLPELGEQKAIAAVLNTARDDLAATEREIEAVTLQKRGLMQKLLTGEWRVNSEKELA